MSDVILYNNKIDCCACGACVNICPKQAISMEKDEYGFLYPIIDKNRCVKCLMCKKVCSYQNKEECNTTKIAYVGMIKDEKIIEESASGGIFAAVGKAVLNKKGVVFGCSMEVHNDVLSPEHIKIEKIGDLNKLQGSKYVQSFIGTIYKEVKEELNSGRLVLFSGTPCQVAALNSFLGDKEYSNLLTIDIICHGVPSADFFQSYLTDYSKKLGGKIIGFKFRDKVSGWGLKGSVEYIDRKEKKKIRPIPVLLSSYYQLFLNAETYRENCYACKYAESYRPGDFTIGDYWGIDRVHPEYLMKNGGDFNETKGISCILVNTEQGKKLFKILNSEINFKESSFENVAKYNTQLNIPSKKSPNREKILEMYKNGSYLAVDRWYFKQLGIKKYLLIIKNKIPQSVKVLIKEWCN